MLNSITCIVFLVVPITTTTQTSATPGLTSSPAPCISASYLSYMSEYNVITLENFKTSSDVEGRTIVCGDFLTTSATFGNQLPKTTFNPFTYTLEINGATTQSGGTINIDTGSVALSPYPADRFVKKPNTNNQYTVDKQITFVLNQGNPNATVRVDETLPRRCATIVSSIKQLSATLSQMLPNNNVTFPSEQPGPLNFYVTNVDANGVAVYNVSIKDVFGNSKVQQMEIIAKNTNIQLVVINVYGSNARWSGSNFVGNWLNNGEFGRSHTIWNFYQAESLDLSPNMRGAVLAPYAVVTTGSNVDGAIAAKTLYAGGEVHLPVLTTPTCASTTVQTTTGWFLTNYLYNCSLYYRRISYHHSADRSI